MPVSEHAELSRQESMAPPLRLAVFISGGGTTLINLQQQIATGRLAAEVKLVLASRPCAGIARLQDLGLPVTMLERKAFPDTASYSHEVFRLCRDQQIELVVLAGFLSRICIPADFELRVMNIHPALIPSFCGQGMFGHHVHEAVITRGCKVSGCTVHFCDNEYDHGPIISQHTVPVLPEDTPDRLAARVFEAECTAYPEAISLFAAGRLRVEGRRVTILDTSPGQSNLL